ncbi:carbohydrate ABC transporter membrane protein 2, CUT1 family [Jatrophihabitans endophyticus]|uniref:Carbohydrate ABC transporter membrane protein 2, CUT1 family n=1 Tax=Jatrophihabitans endophyticus TaxID=1206085 RepID=A0A1M5DFZ6_9ACTN|nr:carbohydrate ABC transporter permease [Jatrophihabitans endophyticus]SHF65948.1 carbohydrate ABC transporter membrane protein 2, CUT1 family [Jatrophihabitans endophyticus]
MTLTTRQPTPSRRREPRTPGRLVKRAALYATLSVAAFLVLLPVIWMILTSFKPEGTITSHPSQLFPTQWTFQNYRDVLDAIPFARQFGNTLVFAGTVTAFSLLFDSMTAYALARLEFPGKRVLFAAVLLFLMLPIQITLIPVYQLVANLDLVNTFPGLIIPRATNAFGIFFLRQFFLGIPRDLSEAARIDGAGEFRIYWTIVMPLARPALLTLGLFHFMFNWNDLLWPLIISTSSDMQTLPAGLALFTGEHVVQYGLLMAGATMAMLPMLLAFVVVQRKFIQGIATTGLK